MTDAMTQNGTVNGNAPVQPGAAGEVAGSGTDASVSEVVPMCQPMPISELPIDQPLHQEEDEEPIGLLGEMLKAEASPAAAATAAAQAAQAAAVHDDLGIPAEAGLEEEAMKMVGGSALASPRDDGRAAVMERGSGGRGCKRRRQSQYSRFRGVTMNKKGKYVAQLWTGERMCYLGAHDTGEEAAEAYDQAVRAYGLVSEKELNFPLPEEDGVQQALTQMPSRRHQQLRGSKAGGWRDDGDGDLGNGLAGDARLQAAAAQLDEPPLEMAPPWTTLPEEGAPLYVGAPIGPLQVAARDDGYHDLLARHPPPPPPLLPKLTLPPPEPQLQQPMLMQQQQQQQRQAQGLFGDAMLAGGMAAGPGYHGVSWVRGKFQAHILWQGRHVFIGRYSDEVEAARAYDQKVLQVTAGAVTPYTLNFPEEAMRVLAGARGGGGGHAGRGGGAARGAAMYEELAEEEPDAGASSDEEFWEPGGRRRERGRQARFGQRGGGGSGRLRKAPFRLLAAAEPPRQPSWRGSGGGGTAAGAGGGSGPGGRAPRFALGSQAEEMMQGLDIPQTSPMLISIKKLEEYCLDALGRQLSDVMAELHGRCAAAAARGGESDSVLQLLVDFIEWGRSRLRLSTLENYMRSIARFASELCRVTNPVTQHLQYLKQHLSGTTPLAAAAAAAAQPAAGAALPPATADIHNPAAAAGVWPGMFHPGLQGHL